MIKSDWEKRKRVEDMALTFLSLAPMESLANYFTSLTFKYEGGGECWLDLLPFVEFEPQEAREVVSFFSYINPKWFPPKPSILKIKWRELKGGKSRAVSKGITIDEQMIIKGLYRKRV